MYSYCETATRTSEDSQQGLCGVYVAYGKGKGVRQLCGGVRVGGGGETAGGWAEAPRRFRKFECGGENAKDGWDCYETKAVL